MTQTVKITQFTSPTARRRGTRPIRTTTHLIAEVTRVATGEAIAVYTPCGVNVSLIGIDQTRDVSYLPAAEREATCKRCTHVPAAR